MAIIVSCTCGRKLRADSRLAERWVRCPACGKPVQIRAPSEHADEMIVLQQNRAPSMSAAATATPTPFQPPDLRAYRAPRAVISAPSPSLEQAERTWRGKLFWLLLLALLPLGIMTFAGHDDPLERLKRTLEKHPGIRIDLSDPNRISVDDLEAVIAQLPDRRLDGALLPQQTWMHWTFAFTSAGLFTLLVAFALPGFPAKPQHVLFAGLFTGTAGVLLLYGIQIMGFFCFCCIGAAYLAALDPGAPFGASLIGFFFGVGFFEELIKSLPVLWLLYHREHVPWRTACIIGMASGAGFGVSEGIHYSSGYYNGIEPAMTYFVRFLSCVAFHTLLSGACAILLQRKLNYLHEGDGPFDWCMTFMAIVSVPILLHGLFNALEKKDLSVASFAVAICSFAWLARLVHTSRQQESGISTAKLHAPRVVRTEKGTQYLG